MTEEVETGVLRVPPAVRVFAVHNPRLFRVQFQAQGPEPFGNGGPQVVGLFLSVAVRDNVVGIALEGAARELPSDPAIERIVHEQVGQDGRDRGTL